EVPIMDGSAAPWVALIEQAGSVCQAARRRVIRVHKPVQVRNGDKYALLLPADSTRFTVEIDFPNPVVGFQSYDLELTGGRFQRDIAAARTFGFLPEIEALRRQGLARGGSTDNAIVIDGGRVLNPEGLRFADEFVRHKILDCIGDLYLAGAPILGHVVGRKVGHQLNNELLRALFAEPGAWSYATYDSADEVPAGIGGELLAA
nr:UDP-3-O-acyl-N-acetylglucosamine deacetylase [Pseudomonadota bacterium]